MWVSVSHTCSAHGGQRGHKILGIIDRCETPCGYWKWNLSLLQEHVVLTIKPSLQAPPHFFWERWGIMCNLSLTLNLLYSLRSYSPGLLTLLSPPLECCCYKYVRPWTVLVILDAQANFFEPREPCRLSFWYYLFCLLGLSWFKNKILFIFILCVFVTASFYVSASHVYSTQRGQKGPPRTEATARHKLGPEVEPQVLLTTEPSFSFNILAFWYNKQPGKNSKHPVSSLAFSMSLGALVCSAKVMFIVAVSSFLP